MSLHGVLISSYFSGGAEAERERLHISLADWPIFITICVDGIVKYLDNYSILKKMR